MNIFRLVLVLATLSLSSQANAELHQFTFKSVLQPDNSINGTMVYPAGTTITG